MASPDLTVSDGTTVTLVSTQVHRAAVLLEDQLRAVADDLLLALERGVCAGTASTSSLILTEATERLVELTGHLESLEYGDRQEPVEMAVSTLFPPASEQGLPRVRRLEAADAKHENGA